MIVLYGRKKDFLKAENGSVGWGLARVGFVEIGHFVFSSIWMGRGRWGGLS